VFFCDIDTKFPKDHLRNSMALARNEENRYVTAVTVHEGAKNLGALFETIGTNMSLIPFFLMTYLFDKNPGPINGAANLFSKKLLEKAGGAEQILNVLTEDAVLERAFKAAGGVGYLAPDYVRVTQAHQSLKGFVQRQFRWMMIAKCYFYPQCLITPLFWIWQWFTLLGLLSASHTLLFAGLFLLVCRLFACSIYQTLLAVPVADRFKSPILILGDILVPILWIFGLAVKHVVWGGRTMRVNGDGGLQLIS
jgi:cellulose synthase/poly-beta-1,6-N-acetylglucosamine synthase-like glycosyltransferase